MEDQLSIPKDIVELVGTLTIENYFLKKEIPRLREELKQVKEKLDFAESNSQPV